MGKTTDLLDYLITQLAQLPQNVQLICGALVAFFIMRSFFLALRLRLISALTNILYALIVGLVFARYGFEIAAIISNFTSSEARNVEN